MYLVCDFVCISNNYKVECMNETSIICLKYIHTYMVAQKVKSTGKNACHLENFSYFYFP